MKELSDKIEVSWDLSSLEIALHEEHGSFDDVEKAADLCDISEEWSSNGEGSSDIKLSESSIFLSAFEEI